MTNPGALLPSPSFFLWCDQHTSPKLRPEKAFALSNTRLIWLMLFCLYSYWFLSQRRLKDILL